MSKIYQNLILTIIVVVPLFTIQAKAEDYLESFCRNAIIALTVTGNYSALPPNCQQYLPYQSFQPQQSYQNGRDPAFNACLDKVNSCYDRCDEMDATNNYTGMASCASSCQRILDICNANRR